MIKLSHLLAETLAVEASFPTIFLKEHGQVKPGSREQGSLILFPDPELPNMRGCSAGTAETAHREITFWMSKHKNCQSGAMGRTGSLEVLKGFFFLPVL